MTKLNNILRAIKGDWSCGYHKRGLSSRDIKIMNRGEFTEPLIKFNQLK